MNHNLLNVLCVRVLKCVLVSGGVNQPIGGGAPQGGLLFQAKSNPTSSMVSKALPEAYLRKYQPAIFHIQGVFGSGNGFTSPFPCYSTDEELFGRVMKYAFLTLSLVSCDLLK